MAGMALNRPYAANSQQVSVAGTVATANSTSPTVTGPSSGAKFTVAKSATGLVRITFNDTYAQFLGVSASVGAANATTAPTVVYGGHFWTAATNTLTLMLVASATGALANPGATETITFDATFMDTLVA